MPINSTHEGHDQAGAPTTHNGLLETCPAPECQDRLIEQQDDAEPELTEAQKAYNVTQYELFQLGAYGHYTYAPDRNNDGTFKTLSERETNTKDYNQRLRAAQTRFEAAALLKAADYFQSILDQAQKPEENAYYWTGVQHTVQGLHAQAADLLKELSDQ
jgi:hypothetical protein